MNSIVEYKSKDLFVEENKTDKVLNLKDQLPKSDLDLFEEFDPITASVIRDLGLSIDEATAIGA